MKQFTWNNAFGSIHTKTTDAYHLYEIDGKIVKPGLVKMEAGSGENIEVDTSKKKF